VALALAVAGLGLGGALWRDDVVEAWPASARLYGALGMPAETLGAGLQLQGVQSERRVEEGTTVLAIQGQITNVSDRERPVPGLRAMALGPDRAELRSWDIEPSRMQLRPGEIATFESVLKGPEESIAEIAITFRNP
jgi:hypothetical protein